MNAVRNTSGSGGRAWPDYPREAEASLRKQMHYQRVAAHRDEMNRIADFLARPEVSSFVLPLYGRAIPYDTKALLSAQLAVPAERFILEYRVETPRERAGIYSPEQELVRLLLVERSAEARELRIIDLLRVYTDEPLWHVGVTDFSLAGEERIEFKAQKQRLIAPRSERSRRLRFRLYKEEERYRVLAHFLLLYNLPNIYVEKVPAPHRSPDYYHRLRYSGPTPFNWDTRALWP